MLLVSRYAEIEIHLVVIGRQVRVGNGPVLAVTVAAPRFEVVIGKAQSEASPNIGLAAKTTRAGPGIVRARVGMVFLVHHDVLAVIALAPALDVRIHVVVRHAFGVRAGAKRVLGRSQNVRTWW